MFKNNLHRSILHPMATWGLALEDLRQRHHLTIGELCRRVKMERSQYYKIRFESKDGPSLDMVQRFLVAMECNWHDWARACERVIHHDDAGEVPRKTEASPRGVGRKKVANLDPK